MKRLINYYGTRCLRALAILFLGTGLLCHGQVWGYESSGLTLSLHADPDHAALKFTLGEAITLIMVISNNTDGSITTDRGFSQVELHHSLIVIDPGGKRHELRQENEAHRMPSPFFLNDQPWGLAETLRADWVRSVTIEDLTELIPMMKTTPGWYTIEAQQPFVRYARTGQDAGLGFLGLLDHPDNWPGTVKSDKIQILIAPAEDGAQIKVQVMDSTDDPAKPLAQVPVKVFRVNDLPSGYDLAGVWDQFEPVLIGTTNFEGWAVWNSGTPCIPRDDYTATAYYQSGYGEIFLGNAEVSWGPDCSGLFEKQILLGESPFPALSTFSVFALNSVWVKEKATVYSGNIGVLDESRGLWLDSRVEVSIGIGSKAEDGVQIFGDSVKIWWNASVDDVFYNDMDNYGTVRGNAVEGLELPLPVNLPTFPDITPGKKNVTVKYKQVKNLAPGNYSNVEISSKGTLRLTGGEYNFKNLNLDYKSSLVCLAPAEIRIKERLYTGLKTRLIPDSDSNLTAKDMVFYVEGTNGNPGNLLSDPKAAEIGAKSEVKASFYIPNGTLVIGAYSKATGSFIAQGVVVGEKSKVTLDSAF